MKSRSVVPAITAAPSAFAHLDDSVAALLDGLGELAGERALILGRDIGIMCELIRRGCMEVTELEQNERPEARMADLVIVPSVGTTDAAVCAIAHARRGLTQLGRILVRTAADPSAELGRVIERTLRLHGFSLIRVRRTIGRAVFTAELPLFGVVARS